MSGYRRARRRKCTIGTRARTDMVSFMPAPNGECGTAVPGCWFNVLEFWGEGSEEGLECFNIEERRKITYGVTYCSGARRASVAVWGSLKERLSLLNGTWVSPGVVACHGTARYITSCMRKKQQRACEMGRVVNSFSLTKKRWCEPRPWRRMRRFSSVPSSLGE